MKYFYTCKVCDATWEAASRNFEQSHLSSSEHIRNKTKADRDNLLSALEFLVRAADTEPGMSIYAAHIEAARAAIKRATNV